jgi:hypothetical protein
MVLSARQEVSRDIQKSVPLAAGRSLRVEHSQGSIAIHTQAQNQVDVHASLRCSADRLEEAHQGCDQINVKVEESASGVLVRTKFPETGFFSGHRNLSWAVDIEIAMPENAPLDLRDQFGAVSVTGLRAPANIVAGNGKVSFTGGRGRQHIETSFGDIVLARNDGDVTIVNSNGRVTASDVTGALDVRDNFGEIQVTNVGKRLDIASGNANVTASGVGGPIHISDSFGKVTVRDTKSDLTVRSQNGDLEATAIAGSADLRTTFGSVHFSNIGKGATVHAESSQITGDTVGGPVIADTTFGAIDVHGVKGGAHLTAQSANIRAVDIGGEVYAKSSFGGIQVEDVAQPITVENQSGSVTVRTKASGVCHPISVNTSFAPIKVVLPGALGFDLTASTTFGQIHSEPPLTLSGRVGNDSVSGKIAGGGCSLKLTNQNGNIDILR